MISTIFAAFFVAGIKKYKWQNSLKEPSLFPVLILEAILIFFQITVFFGNYYFVSFASVLKLLFMLSLLYPFFKFKLYIQGAIGGVFVILGTILNKIAITCNNGKMPVFPSLSYLTGYVNADSFKLEEDTLHILGNTATKCKFLTDFIDVGYSILSVGDLLIRVYVFLIIYSTIRAVEKKKESI